MTKPCEAHQTSLSALLDAELPPAELLPAIDHLAECPSCRTFYRQARALGGLLAAAESQDLGSAPNGVWQRIRETDRRRRPRRRSWPGRTLQLAAVLIVGVGLGLLAAGPLAPGGRGPEVAGSYLEVELGSDPGAMTDQRFVALTVELLRAEASYHREMLAVMSAIASAAGAREGEGAEGHPAWPREDLAHSDLRNAEANDLTGSDSRTYL